MSAVAARLRALARGTPLLRDLYDAQWHLRRHRRRTGRWPNPIRPRSLNDIVMRRLILTRDPLHARVSDKLAMRETVRERLGGGEDPCVPLLGTWDDAAALARDWDALPAAFVLKPNHGSGMVQVVPDREAADRAAVLRQAEAWLATSFYETGREWGYRHIRPRLLAERLVPEALDCRVYVFDGRIALLRVKAQQEEPVLASAFDATLRRLALVQNGRADGGLPPPTPAQAARIAGLARRLCAGWDFMRVDFLLDGAGDVAWLGELTPFPSAGVAVVESEAWTVWLADVWRATRAGRPWPPMPA